ncbi:MAG: sugar ABC transporter permease [Anaerolineae bacterium]|nr:sugar ABC transporter permease [Anaerolineae bacterium]
MKGATALRNRWQISPKTSEAIAAYLFLLPTLVTFFLFVLGPMLAAVGLSFFDYNLLKWNSSPEFIGFDNYRQLAEDGRIVSIYQTTLKIAVAEVALTIGLGLLIAYLLEQKMPSLLRSLFRMTYFFPYVVSVSAVALIWSYLLHKDFGIVNYYLGLLGIERISWLRSSQWSWVSIVITESWKSLGFNVLVLLGGLQTIPAEFYEAAEVDGANGWGKFRHVTLPLLTPTLLFLLVIDSINAFQIFAQPYILTQGGPGDSSRTVVMYIYEHGFRFFNMGYASTIALSLFAIILVLTIFQFRLSRRWVFYQ